MSEPVISAKGLGKCYRLFERPGDRIKELLSPSRHRYHREFWALRELDLTVAKGECVGLVGANGAGKSTTLKLLAGKLHPTTGTAEVRGRLSSILELGTGFQPHLTGRQNAFVSALFMGLAPWEADGHVERIIEFAEIGAHADQPLSTYSSGMQARLAFAALTTLDPEVLILDEALATGDARFAQKCNDYLRALCRSGCTTIIASHDVRFLVGTCDRLVWIDRGRAVAAGAPGAIVQQYLEALGAANDADDAWRPKQVLLRLAAAAPDLDPAFALHALHWVDGGENLIGQHYLGDDTSWQALLDGAASTGFTAEGARAGWGPAELAPEAFLIRTCRPPADGAFLTLPLPPAPAPVPSGLRVILKSGAACDAVLSLQVDGRWTELGRTGGTPAAERPWEPVTFDVRGALPRTSVPAPPAAGGRT